MGGRKGKLVKGEKRGGVGGGERGEKRKGEGGGLCRRHGQSENEGGIGFQHTHTHKRLVTKTANENIKTFYVKQFKSPGLRKLVDILGTLHLLGTFCCVATGTNEVLLTRREGGREEEKEVGGGQRKAARSPYFRWRQATFHKRREVKGKKKKGGEEEKASFFLPPPPLHNKMACSIDRLFKTIVRHARGGGPKEEERETRRRDLFLETVGGGRRRRGGDRPRRQLTAERSGERGIQQTLKIKKVFTLLHQSRLPPPPNHLALPFYQIGVTTSSLLSVVCVCSEWDE